MYLPGICVNHAVRLLANIPFNGVRQLLLHLGRFVALSVFV